MNNQTLTPEQIKTRTAAAGRALCDPKTKLTGRGRRRLQRLRETRYIATAEQKPAGEKYIVKLASLTMHQLGRRLKQAVRLASHFGHLYAKNPESNWAAGFQTLQDNALECFKHVQTEVAFRDKRVKS